MPPRKSPTEVFISEFSVWGIVQNGKLGVEKPRKIVLRGFRDFRFLHDYDMTESVWPALYKLGQTDIIVIEASM